MRKIINFLSYIQFFIKVKSLPGSLIIVYKRSLKKKMFLLIKSKHSNAITFPSGGLKIFENFSEAAKRELLEETGLNVKENKLILTPLKHRFRYRNLAFKIKSQQKVFVLPIISKDLLSKPQDKHIEWVRWYNFKKTLSLISYPELKTIFKKSLKYLNR